VSGAEGSNKNRFAFSARFIPGGVRRAQARTTLTYRLTPRLQAGIEVNPRSTEERANPLVNWLAVPEGKNTPAVILGTSSDRIGTPGGQSFYATASKNLRRETKLPIAPYFGIAYGTHQDRLRYIGGVNIGFTEQLSSLVIFDGVHVHPLLNFSYKRHVFSFLLVRGKEPGISYSLSF
jgi:hypothetical protein